MPLNRLVERHRCIAIVGMEKNAGKTTVLNHLLEHCRGRSVAITSIGYDGEETDQVTGTAKPRIYVEKGTLIATAAALLARCDITRELLKFTGLSTSMGEVIIVRARSDGFVQIAGPAITAQMEKLLQMFRAFHPEKIFIDGAAARKSSAAISTADACLLATGAAVSADVAEVVENTAFSAALLNLPVCKDPGVMSLFAHLPESSASDDRETGQCYAFTDKFIDIGSSLDDATALRAAQIDDLKMLVFKGAFPAGFARRFLEKTRLMPGLRLVARDGTRFLLNAPQFKEFLRRGAVFEVGRFANLLAITVNPVSPAGFILDSKQLKQKLQLETGLPVYDVILNPGAEP